MVKALDFRYNGLEVALKISRNKKYDLENAQTEIKILETLNKNDPENKYGVVKLMENFTFRMHMVLVFEVLGTNLFRYTRQENFPGIKKEFLR